MSFHQKGTKFNSKGYFALQCSLGEMGVVSKVSGGGVTAEKAEIKVGGERHKRFAIANYKVEPIKLTIALGQIKGLWGAIQATLDDEYQRFDGAIMAMNPDRKVTGTREFTNACISSIKFPTADAKSKDIAQCEVEFRVGGEIKYIDGDGSKQAAVQTPKAKQALCNNFKVEVPGMPCDHITKLECGEVKVPAEEVYRGGQRMPDVIQSGVELSECTLTIGAQDQAKWADWVRSHVIAGETGEAAALACNVTWFDPSMKNEIMSLDFINCIPVEFKVGDLEANATGMAECTVKMVFEDIKVTHPGCD